MTDTLAATQPERAAPITRAVEPRVRLEFLDGIRGLAALYVVLYHIVRTNGLPPALRAATAWMDHGSYAVAVFIVLSGYCLMLPMARSQDGRLRGGWRSYLKRRSRRILPPYYAALALTLAHIAVTQLHKGTRDFRTFRPGNLLSHVTLTHNLRIDWAQTIDPPMWSVATEWQIYFLFPLILLPVWRRAGSFAAAVAGFALGLAPHMLLPRTASLDWARYWYIGLFAVGMAAAATGFRNTVGSRRWRDELPWGGIAAIAAILVVLATGSLGGRHRTVVLDVLVGAAAASLIVSCARAAGRGRRSLVLRILESRPAQRLGQFSYSLYLVHFPIFWTIQPALRKLPLSPAASLAIRLLVVVPVVLGCAWIFHLLFERRFMPLSPAPPAPDSRPFAVVQSAGR